MAKATSSRTRLDSHRANGEVVDQVLAGRSLEVNDLPNGSVSIYVASSGDDFLYEREQLWQAVLPELQEVCVSRGLDIQFIDYQHGCHLHHAYDRCLLDQHLKQISHCSSESSLQIFLCMIGNKHGFVPLPAYLDEQEYSSIEESNSAADVAVLNKWFVKDESSNPVRYCLRPLESYYPSARMRGRLSSEDESDWLATHSKLLEMFQSYARSQFANDSLPKGEEHKHQRFFMSTVQLEIQEALQLSNSKCIFVDRRFQGMNFKDKTCGQYLDMSSSGAPVTESAKRLHTLKDILYSKLKEKQILLFEIEWTSEGMNPEGCPAHANYLHSLISSLGSQIVELIDTQLALEWESNNAVPMSNTTRALYQEIACHVNHCKKQNQRRLYGFEDGQERIRKLLMAGANESHQGILLHGPDGCGKTALASSLPSIAREALGKDCVVLIRYISLTVRSRTLHDILLNLVAQLYCTLQTKPPGSMSLNQMDSDQLLSHFHGALIQLGRTAVCPTVIILDDIHRIKYLEEEKHIGLHWLATDLLPNVNIIATISDTERSPFKNVHDCFQQEDHVMLLSQIELKHAKGIAREYAHVYGQVLTQEQEKTILKHCDREASPLLAQSITYVVLNNLKTNDINSMNDKSDTERLCHSINRCFATLEEHYEPSVVTELCRYISAANYGLTETEILDILSCNNDLMLRMNEDVPLEESSGSRLRFPVWVLHSLLRNMQFLITKRIYEKKLLITWSHKIITNQAMKRYRHSINDIKRVHSDIAELFIEKWVGNKPMVDQERAVFLVDNACRFVSPQPLLYSETEYNYRRLAESWFQLLHTGDIAWFKEQTLCNFEYLLATLHGCNLGTLLQQLDIAVAHVLDTDLQVIQRCIQLSKDVLRRDATQLAMELLGRLRHIKEHSSPFIEALMQQCMEWCDAHPLPIIVPLSSWQPDPRREVVTSLTCRHQIACMCITPNNQHVMCAMEGTNEIHMYHLASLRLITTYKGAKGAIHCMLVSKDNKFLYCGCKDQQLCVWNIQLGKLHHIFSEHKGPVLCIKLLSKTGNVITGSHDGFVRVLNAESKSVCSEVSAHEEEVTCMALSKGEAMLVTGSKDKSIKVWSLDDMSHINTISGNFTTSICSIALTEDNIFLLAGCEEGVIYVKSFTTGTDGHILDAHSGMAKAIMTSKDSHHCLVSSSNGHLYTYNFRTRKILHTYMPPDHVTGPVSSCHLTKDENLIVASCGDTVTVWTFYKETKAVLTHDNHADIVTCIATSRDGKLGISGSRDNTVKLWNLEISDLVATWSAHDAQVTCVDIAENDAFVVTGSEDTTVKVWSLMMGCVITDYRGHRSTVVHVVAMVHSLDDFRVLSAEEDSVVHAWQPQDGVCLLTVETPVTLLAVSPSMKFIITGPDELDLKLWRVENATLVGRDIRHVDSITCVQFSQDSRYFVTGSADCSLKVWETCSGKLNQVLVDHSATVTCCCISNGNRHIISGSFDRRVLIWGLETGAVEHQLLGHDDKITCVLLTKDSSTVISGSRDETLCVWSMATGLLITKFHVHYPVHNIEITPTADRIILQLDSSYHVPVLCLHNSPACADAKSNPGQPTSTSRGNMSNPIIHQCSVESTYKNEEENLISTESQILPIKPKMIQLTRPAQVFLKANKPRRPSLSSVPDIRKVSPQKAPLQETMLAQEKNKQNRSLIRNDFSSHGSSQTSRSVRQQEKRKKSNICSLL